MLQGVLNARDLGGIRIGDKTVRSGLLLRTAHLNDATDEDVRHLSEDLHLKKIFDFRTFQESSAQPDRPIPGAEHILISMPMRFAEKRVRHLQQGSTGISDAVCCYGTSRDGREGSIRKKG